MTDYILALAGICLGVLFVLFFAFVLIFGAVLF